MTSFIDKIKTPSIIILSAGPGSGKSYTIKYLLYCLFKQKKLKYGVVFCPTNAMNNNYDYIDSKFVYPSFDEENLKKFLRFQKQHMQPAFIIFDDCIGSINFNSNLIIHLFTTFRHYNLTIFLATQYIYKVPPTLRECATYTFIFNVSNMRTIEALQETYFLKHTKQELATTIAHHTEPKNENDKGKFILVRVNAPESEKYSASRAPPNIRNFKLKFN